MTYFLSEMSPYQRMARIAVLRRRCEKANADLFGALREHQALMAEDNRFNRGDTPPVPMDWAHCGQTVEVEP